MNLHLQSLREAVGPLGGAGIGGVALLALALALHVARVAPLEREMAALQAEAGSLQSRLRSGKALNARADESSAEQLAAFYAYFPPAAAAPELLGKIHAAAAANGIVLRSGEYKLERNSDQRLARYQVTLPIAGSYAQVRRFVSTVLADVPAASVDEIQMRRETIAATTLEVRVRLSIYLRT
jgi:Tfp pilus assembly protein PilO